MTNFKRLLIMIAAIATLSFNSCKKDNFDEPPYNTTDPNIANATILELRALFTSGNPISVTDDIIIGGVVTADDKSGNFYKQIVIQDSTGAIPVLINRSGLNSDYPIGRKVYVKCKSLVLGQYGKNVQLGGYIDYTGSQPSVGNIASALIDKYIVKGPNVTPIVPKKISSFSELNFTTDQSILIELDPVSFTSASGGLPYADIVNGVSLSRAITDCNGASMDVRTSNFASFGSANTPDASIPQSMVGIYSVFGTSTTLPPKQQFTIRELSEVKPTTTACPSVLFSQDFTGLSTSGNLAIADWTNYATAGGKYWQVRGTSDLYAQMSAFSSSSQDPSNIVWLITPSFNLDISTDEALSFSTYAGFYDNAVLELLYSTDYTSGDPTSATWNSLSATIAITNSWTPSGSVSLRNITGTNVHFAFKYTGGYVPDIRTTQYRVDNVKIVGRI